MGQFTNKASEQHQVEVEVPSSQSWYLLPWRYCELSATSPMCPCHMMMKRTFESTRWSSLFHSSLGTLSKMSTRTNSHFLTASVNEFLQVWALGGTASLTLTTSNGQATVGFNCTLGLPGAPHSLSPSQPATPPRRQPRHRGPSEIERNRQRAARHQAAMATASTTSSSPVTASVATKFLFSTASVTTTSTTASVASPKSSDSQQLDYKLEF